MLDLALAAFKNGDFVIVTDDALRENEGDLIIRASTITTEQMAFMVGYTSGIICVAMEIDRARQLELPPMVVRNQDSKQTAFTLSVDAKEGLTTGVSAKERAATVRRLGDPHASEHDFIRPGHIFPLRGVEGGLHVRGGHTEAAIALCELTQQFKVAAISEIITETGDMARGQWLIEFGQRWNIPIISIAELALALLPTKIGNPSFEPKARALLPREGANWEISIFRGSNGDENVLLTLGDLTKNSLAPLVRIHSECFTGEVLNSIRCECGPQLLRSFEIMEEEGIGAIIYLRGHEGRGIGLLEKIKAYALQDDGMDTVDANISLGHDPDARDWGDALEILRYLKLNKIRLLTNNPEKILAVTGAGIGVEPIGLIIESNKANRSYLASKRDRMGHLLPQDSSVNFPDRRDHERK